MSKFPAKERALGMYRKMYEIRKYEESIYYLFLEGIMPGTIHQSTGEEASAVGMLYDLRKEDWMASTHRPAGHDIAKGISVKAMMCEMFGAADGCCHGIGGAMHTGDISVGAMTANAIVGGNLPIAAGAALAFKMRGQDNVVVCFFGDGASNEAATRAIARARAGEGPTILELKTYRHGGHSRNDACGYRPKDEEKRWIQDHDPVKMFRERILKEGAATEDELKQLETEVETEVDEAVEYAKTAPLPENESALHNVFWEG